MRRIGTWMQSAALSRLVLGLTHPRHDDRTGEAVQSSVGAAAGLIADRVPKHSLLMVIQSAFGGLPLLLGLLAATHPVPVCGWRPSSPRCAAP